MASFFSKAGKPRAEGVAGVAASGGACVIMLDKSEAAGVAMPPLAPDTRAALEQHVPDYGSVANPCDITAGVAADGAASSACVEAMLGDPSYSSVVVMRSDEHTSELHSLMNISYADSCSTQKKKTA